MTRRSVLVVCAALATASTPLAAQTAPSVRGPTRFGVLAGVNVATLRGDDDGDVGHLIGFVGGAYLSLGLTPTLSFRPELLYSMKGAETTSSDEGVTVKAKVQLDYVELPLLVAAELPVAGRIRPQLYAGPALAFKVRCRTSVSGGSLSFSGDCEAFDDADAETDLKSFDVGAMVGGALTFELPRGAFTVGARYTLGLTTIVDGGETKNRVLGVVASYELPIGR